jgi:hypothetical protein
VVARDAFGGLAADAGDAQTPAQSEGTVAVAGAVDQVQLRLEAVPAGRQGNRHGKITRARVQVGREFLADSLEGAAPFGQGDHLA